MLTQQEKIFDVDRCYVAYSGGIDSHVLLHALVQLREQFSDIFPTLQAIHIHHQLHPDADRWADHCQQVCRQLDVPLILTHVTVKRAGGESLEAVARQARYRAFEEQLDTGDYVLLAHHLDDQIETFFMRMLRGSGTLGMSAMSAKRALGKGYLWRPFLAVPRAVMVRYAKQYQLQWVEDSSNQDHRYSRNVLRGQVLPTIEQHWPQYRQTLERAIALNREAQQLNMMLAVSDCQRLELDVAAESLPLAALNQLSTLQKKNILRYWLQQRGLSLPSAVQLQAICKEVLAARVDAQPSVVWSDVEAHRFQDQLFIIKVQPDFDANQAYTWNLEAALTLKGAGKLVAHQATGRGLSNRKALTIRFRQGGERCKPVGRNHSQTLKKLFQEYHIPPWLRDRVPLLYQDDHLVAVGHYWICDGYQATEGRIGWVIDWVY